MRVVDNGNVESQVALTGLICTGTNWTVYETLEHTFSQNYNIYILHFYIYSIFVT